MKAAAGAPENSFVVPAAGWANWRPSILDICEICPHTYSVHNIYCSECEKTKTVIEHEFMVRVIPSKVQAERDKRLAEAADYYSPYREGQRKDKEAARELINEARFNLHHPPTDKCGYCDQARKSLDSAFSVVSTAYMNQIRLLKSLSNTQTEPEESSK